MTIAREGGDRGEDLPSGTAADDGSARMLAPPGPVPATLAPGEQVWSTAALDVWQLPPPTGQPYPLGPTYPPRPTDPLSATEPLSGTQPPGSAWPLGHTGPLDGAVPHAPSRPARRRRAGLIAALVAAVVVAMLASALVGGIAGVLMWESRDSASAPIPAPPPGATARPAGSIAGIAARVLPSVVTIQTRGRDAQGTGSGFVLKSDGYILTNNHVVEAAAGNGTITVEFADGRRLPATIRGRDESYDLAVLKVKQTGLPALPLGDSASVVVGDAVIAVGAPLGLNSTVTSGIVSAVNRPVTPGSESSQSYINAIQTDAAINPGNSGGPLLDMSGRVIGVNSAIARVPGLGSEQSGNIGVGFAIPSAQARTTAQQLIDTGKASHPIIGVLLDPDFDGPGVRIAKDARDGRPPVTKGGPADIAGLAPGDVILAVDGQDVQDSGEFVVGIRARRAGDQVRLTVRSGSISRTVTVTLQASSE